MNNSKKFFIYNIVLNLLVLLIFIFFNFIYTNYLCEENVKFLYLENSKINNLKIVNVGSSHGHRNIKYSQNLNAYNLGASSQDFYYDLKILEKFKNKLGENCIVIIPISIFSFYNGNKLDNINKNYIPFLKRKDILNISRSEYFFEKYFSVIQSFSKRKKVLEFIRMSFKKKKMDRNFITYRKDLSLEEKKMEAKKTAFYHLSINESIEIEMNNLKNIIRFCEDNNFKPILISTPQTYLYNEEIGEKNYKERIYNNIKEIEKQLNKNYLYLDYSHDQRFENNLEYFFDDDHLNEKGAKFFTEILLNDISKYYEISF